MKKEEKLIPKLPSGFEDRWNKQLSIKKKLLEQIAFGIFFIIILGLIIYSVNDLLFS